jgi:hypothetical protein
LTDTANAAYPLAMAALLKLVPASLVVSGSGYPRVRIAVQAAACTSFILRHCCLAEIAGTGMK